MRALIWAGVILIVLGVIGWIVLKIAIWVGIILFVAGVIAVIWGAIRIKEAV